MTKPARTSDQYRSSGAEDAGRGIGELRHAPDVAVKRDADPPSANNLAKSRRPRSTRRVDLITSLLKRELCHGTLMAADLIAKSRDADCRGSHRRVAGRQLPRILSQAHGTRIAADLIAGSRDADCRESHRRSRGHAEPFPEPSREPSCEPSCEPPCEPSCEPPCEPPL